MTTTVQGSNTLHISNGRNYSGIGEDKYYINKIYRINVHKF